MYSEWPESLTEAVRDVILGWDSLMHISVWPVVVVASFMAFIAAHRYDRAIICYDENEKKNERSVVKDRKTITTSNVMKTRKKRCGKKWCSSKLFWYVLGSSILVTTETLVNSQLQIVAPSTWWNPFLNMWNKYHIYRPSHIQQALEGLCLKGIDGSAALLSLVEQSPSSSNTADEAHSKPFAPVSSFQSALCLPEASWKTLSSEGLSSENPEDVETVMKGLKYAKMESGGLVINILSRDTIDSVSPLRQNVEGLVPFFSRVAVVVFENDSKDGTREAFKQWAAEAQGYVVDIIECEEAPDCKFGESHRYDALESKDYFESSAIGHMLDYRQRIVDYITSSQSYTSFSHMLVMDLDLAISISPLGLLHTLGKIPNYPVASSGRQVWPGSHGTLIPPYDFSAFRAYPTKRTRRILKIHETFCGIKPIFSRWHNICDAVSSFQFMLILGNDRINQNEPYRVLSAFNGATLYPIDIIRSSNAKYDSGDDNQRCEHVGFNLSLKSPFYVNPKWNMHVDPLNPGGPTGYRAAKNIFKIAVTPIVAIPIFIQNFSAVFIFVYAVMILVIYLVYPFWVKILTGSTCRCVLASSSSSPVKDSSLFFVAGGSAPIYTKKNSNVAVDSDPCWVPKRDYCSKIV